VRAFARASPAVGVWVTNNAAVQSMVLGTLLPAWGLNHVHTIAWLKVRGAAAPSPFRCLPGHRTLALTSCLSSCQWYWPLCT
jgi:hypothetical protein